MKQDVYSLIIELCEVALDSIPKSKNHQELGLEMITQLSAIIGVCGGAKASEKGDKREVE